MYKKPMFFISLINWFLFIFCLFKEHFPIGLVFAVLCLLFSLPLQSCCNDHFSHLNERESFHPMSKNMQYFDAILCKLSKVKSSLFFMMWSFFNNTDQCGCVVRLRLSCLPVFLSPLIVLRSLCLNCSKYFFQLTS